MTTGFGGEAEQARTPGGYGSSKKNFRKGATPRTRNAAFALLRRTFERLSGSERAKCRTDGPEWMDDLYDSVLCAGGGRSKIDSLARSPAAPFLEQVHTEFLASAREDESLDAREVLDVLAALDAVGTAIRRERENNLSTCLDRVSAQDAIVEVAHDMRSPLNAIMMLVRTVLDGRGLADGAAQQLGIVYSAAFGLNALVNDLVDSAVPEGGLLEPLPVGMSISETLQSVRDIVAPVAAEKGLHLRVATVPWSRRLGHPAALHRVLLNLVTNAVKYTDSGGVSLAARELPGGRVEFTVADTGRGMSRPQLASLFTPFRPRTLARRQQSFSSGGLGLALCRSLVRSMGGRILVDSIEGHGTTFRVELAMPEATEKLALVPDPWRDELAGNVAATATGIVLAERPLRIPSRAD